MVKNPYFLTAKVVILRVAYNRTTEGILLLTPYYLWIFKSMMWGRLCEGKINNNQSAAEDGKCSKGILGLSQEKELG